MCQVVDNLHKARYYACMTNYYDAEREELEIEYMSRYDYVSEAYAGMADDYANDDGLTDADFMMPGGVWPSAGVAAMCRALYRLACECELLAYSRGEMSDDYLPF